jgi:hypothetical protein
LEQEKMELREITPPTQDKELEEVAAKIRPLPDNVVPSERFLAQMRARLLKMEQKRTSRQAA